MPDLCSLARSNNFLSRGAVGKFMSQTPFLNLQSNRGRGVTSEAAPLIIFSSFATVGYMKMSKA